MKERCEYSENGHRCVRNTGHYVNHRPWEFSLDEIPRMVREDIQKYIKDSANLILERIMKRRYK